MAIAQGREAKALVFTPIGIVADADHRLVEKPDDRRNNLFAWQAAQGEVGFDALAQRGQAMAKRGEARKFRLVAAGGPVGMIAILLAPALVAAGRLNMSGRIGADPDISPGRRDDQRLDPRQRNFIRQLPAGV